MRLWSLHPKYLDAKGLVALWRETLLAKNVLEGKTKGYVNHPQLDRFKAAKEPIPSIHQYLHFVYQEALVRNYKFDRNKFIEQEGVAFITVNHGQLEYEMSHLLKKLKVRDETMFQELKNVEKIETHPLFTIIEGEIETWEKL